jgi:hypothetical protein
VLQIIWLRYGTITNKLVITAKLVKNMVNNFTADFLTPRIVPAQVVPRIRWILDSKLHHTCRAGCDITSIVSAPIMPRCATGASVGRILTYSSIPRPKKATSQKLNPASIKSTATPDRKRIWFDH